MKQYAIITGASCGIGQALANELIKQVPDITIFAIARNEEALTKLAKSNPNNIIPITSDVSSISGIEKIKEVILNYLPVNAGINYLINNAATIAPIGDFNFLVKEPLSKLQDEMSFAWQTNVISPYLLTVAFSKQLIQVKNSKILFITSRAATSEVPGAATYACTKAAINHLVHNLKASLKNQVSVGLVIPGEVDTNIQNELRIPESNQFEASQVFRMAKDAGQLIPSHITAEFLAYLLLNVTNDEFSKAIWDIYYTHPQEMPDRIKSKIPSPPPYLSPPIIKNL